MLKIADLSLDHLSYSSIKKHSTCPFQFYASKKYGAPPTEALENGKNTHQKMADFLIDRENGIPGEFPGGERLKNFLRFTLPHVDGVEEDFELDLIGIKIVGTIDAYMLLWEASTIRIVDWKQNNSSYVDEDQLKIYAFNLALKFPEIQVFEAMFYFLTPDYPERHTYYREEIMAYGDTLFDNAQKVLSSNFEPTPGSHCQKCEFAEKCSVGKGFQLPVITNLEDAKSLARKLFAAKALVDQGKERLEAFMLDNDIDQIIIGDDRYYLSYAKPILKTGKAEGKKSKGKKGEKAVELQITAPATPSVTITVPVTAELEKAFDAAGQPITSETATGEQNAIVTDALKQKLEDDGTPPPGKGFFDEYGMTPDQIAEEDRKFKEANAQAPAEPVRIDIQLEQTFNEKGEKIKEDIKVTETSAKPKRKRETTTERIARLAAAAKPLPENQAINEKVKQETAGQKAPF